MSLVQCELKDCKAIRPRSEMRAYRGKKPRYRCRLHSTAFLTGIVRSVSVLLTCSRCKTKNPRAEMKKYGGGHKCVDITKCDKNFSSTTFT